MEEVKGIYKKIFDISKELPTFERTERNPFFKSAYTPLIEIHKILKPLLTKYNLVLIHHCLQRTFVSVLLDLDSNEKIVVETVIPDAIVDPQKIGGFMTYMRRYNVVALFNLDTEEDLDGEDAKPTKKGAQKAGAAISNLKKFVVDKLPALTDKEQLLQEANEYVEINAGLKGFDFSNCTDEEAKNALFILTNQKKDGK